MKARYELVAERAHHRCEYCLAPEVIFNFRFEVEHIIPLARNGSDQESNWAIACHACNLYKGDHLEVVDIETKVSVRLFNPRQDQWDTHFRLDAETGMIIGITPIGRVTALRLQMNTSRQLIARQKWIRLKLFP